MDDFSFAKCFDYSLHVAYEVIGGKANKVNQYKIVWKLNNHLVEADAFKYQNNNPIRTTVDKDWQTNDEQMFLVQNKFPSTVREKFFDYFDIDAPFNAFRSLYLNEAELFKQLFNFVDNLHDVTINDFGECLFNVKFLDDNVKLPFISISPKDTIKPVSLISVSEN